MGPKYKLNYVSIPLSNHSTHLEGMTYEAKCPVYISTTDYLELDLHLMDTRPVVKPDAVVGELVKRWQRMAFHLGAFSR